jgi:hypothetical protein
MWLRTSVAPLTKIKKKISLEFGERKTSIITEREEKREPIIIRIQKLRGSHRRDKNKKDNIRNKRITKNFFNLTKKERKKERKRERE